ncbi:uncharacterized protein LOC117038650 [Rhinolophus ferrumequinum]|uniref:uncharacterized protein LOC117038650 n=1 Tax=Rhinolophus ferrumequinum TaxID=59479 RepID=UPI00140FB6C0|nr:uncharacterized protein LOC117038650 [Rhinolophus ferrumequinum]
MAKCAKKIGIDGKYGTRYGASLRKMKKIEISQHAKYTCSFCGKTKMKRRAVAIWHCGSCMKTVAGGAWTYNTTSAVTVKSAIRRLKELKDQYSRSSTIETLLYNKCVNLCNNNNKKRQVEEVRSVGPTFVLGFTVDPGLELLFLNPGPEISVKPMAAFLAVRHVPGMPLSSENELTGKGSNVG